MKTLESLVRPNIWALEPYSCARDEFKGMDAHVFLDANENPYNDPINRYPDPLQEKLKERLGGEKTHDAFSSSIGTEPHKGRTQQVTIRLFTDAEGNKRDDLPSLNQIMATLAQFAKDCGTEPDAIPTVY